MSLTDDTLAYALSLGFDLAGVTPVAPPPHGEAFAGWLAAGYAGEMAYLSARAAERLDPARFAPDARSMIVVAASYRPAVSPMAPAAGEQPAAHAVGRIARFAWSADYHAAIKPRLFELDAFIRARTGRESLGKAFVDSAPVLERDFAEQAGLGFIGRNTCLITPGLGSWTFLAGLLVPEDLSPGLGPPSPPILGGAAPQGGRGVRCGRCTRCLDACPTAALVAPHVLDARRCISYLTIELRGPIPEELRPRMGNWVFGCDVCQEVCPYNRAAPAASWPALAPDPGRAAPALAELLALDEAAFRARFAGTAVLRAKRRGLVRNACIAAGNAGDVGLIPPLAALLADGEPLVREHAAWALRRLGSDGL